MPAALVLLLMLSCQRAAADCPCLDNGGVPGPEDRACDVGQCYADCVDELCLGYPQCMVECSIRCHCELDHVDPGPTPTVRPTIRCIGDCNGDAMVEISEITRGIAMLLGINQLPIASCRDADGDGVFAIHELIQAVGNALMGCPPAPTPTNPSGLIAAVVGSN